MRFFRNDESMLVESEVISRIWNARVLHVKVAALRLWEASRLPFDRPLPGKPPNIPDRLFRLVSTRFLLLRHTLFGDRDRVRGALG
jgi:hypothetical protein